MMMMMMMMMTMLLLLLLLLLMMMMMMMMMMIMMIMLIQLLQTKNYTRIKGLDRIWIDLGEINGTGERLFGYSSSFAALTHLDWELIKLKLRVCRLELGQVCKLELGGRIRLLALVGIVVHLRIRRQRRNHCSDQQCRLQFVHGHREGGRRKIQQRCHWRLGFHSWRSQRQSNHPLLHIHKRRVGEGVFLLGGVWRMEQGHGMVVGVGQLGYQQQRQQVRNQQEP